MKQQAGLIFSAISMGFFCCCFCDFSYAETFTSSPQNISHLQNVDKPAIPTGDRRARVQPVLPEGWKEVPFIETAPIPVATPNETERGFIVFQRPITRTVHINTQPLPRERCTGLSVFATPGEWEPTCFSLYPLRDLKNIRTHVSALQTTNGVSTPAPAVDIRLVTYWNIRYPRYSSQGTYRRLPELLEKVSVNDAAAGECQRYWIRIHIPEDTDPGLYSGTLTVWSDEFDKATAIPLSVNVLPFKLKKDPAKHYSVWYDSGNFSHVKKDFLAQAETNDFQAMIDYGIDALPTFNLNYDRKINEFHLPQQERINRLIALGVKGPLPLQVSNWTLRHLYQKHAPDVTIKGHWIVDQLPPDTFYTELTELIKNFVATTKDYGWPEIFCCPIGEPSPAAAPFAAPAYQAVRAGGFSTFITKNPTSTDTQYYKDLDAVDAWCSQPYSVPYKEVVADQRYQFWTYPNHNACEIRNSEVMSKGGRMTYGFGFWRSGYTVIMPWHWRWLTTRKDAFDYLDGTRSGCGHRLTEEGEFIPAVYWECFREGIDDNRYLYTLQTEIVNREGTTDPACQAVLNKAKAFLQKTWDEIRVQEKYLAANVSIHDTDFDSLRWRMAQLIQALRQFPALRDVVAPSVLVEDTRQKTDLSQIHPLQDPKVIDKLDILDLGNEEFTGWKSQNSEASISVIPEAAHHGQFGMRFTVNVDHEGDGGGEKSLHPIGWPRILLNFPQGKVSLPEYDYLTFWIRIDSNRDEVADDVTEFGITFVDRESGTKHDKMMDLGGEQGVWIPIEISIADFIQESGRSKHEWTHAAFIQFYIAERCYAHGDELIFDIDQIALVKFKKPILRAVHAPTYTRLSSPTVTMDCELFGAEAIQPSNYTLCITVLDYKGNVIAVEKTDPAIKTEVTFQTTELSPGKYKIQFDLLDQQDHLEKSISSFEKTLIVLSEDL